MYTRNDKIVSNTYPAFLRTLDEVSKGKRISDKLINISEYDEFFTSLNDVIKEVYDGANTHHAIDVYDDSSTLLFETDRSDIGFFLLETTKNLILLDIIEMNKFDGLLELIPSKFNGDSIHVKSVNIGGKNYRVTNTYNSLSSFSKINNSKIGFGLNSIFYDRFLQSINCEYPLDVITDADRYVEEFLIDDNGDIINTDMIFNYVVTDDLIIITEYGSNK